MQPDTLIIAGDGALADEVARLGVAYGAAVHMIRADATPPTDDPWVHGVTWHASSGSVPVDVPSGAVVWMNDESPSAAREDARFGDRFVVVTQSGIAPAELDEDVIVAITGPVDDTPVDLDGLDVGQATAAAEPPEGTLRVERAAMALLRAALDDDIPSRLDPADLDHLGDAMMWQ